MSLAICVAGRGRGAAPAAHTRPTPPGGAARWRRRATPPVDWPVGSAVDVPLEDPLEPLRLCEDGRGGGD